MFGLFKKKPVQLTQPVEPSWPPKGLLGFYEIAQHVEGHRIKFRASERDGWSVLVRSYQYNHYDKNHFGYDVRWGTTEFYPTLADARMAILRHNATAKAQLAKLEYEKQFPKHIESVGPKK